MDNTVITLVFWICKLCSSPRCEAMQIHQRRLSLPSPTTVSLPLHNSSSWAVSWSAFPQSKGCKFTKPALAPTTASPLLHHSFTRPYSSQLHNWKRRLPIACRQCPSRQFHHRKAANYRCKKCYLLSLIRRKKCSHWSLFHRNLCEYGL